MSPSTFAWPIKIGCCGVLKELNTSQCMLVTSKRPVIIQNGQLRFDMLGIAKKVLSNPKEILAL